MSAGVELDHLHPAWPRQAHGSSRHRRSGLTGVHQEHGTLDPPHDLIERYTGHQRGLTTLLIRMSGVVCMAQPTASSIGLVECGSLNTCSMKKVIHST